MMNGSNGNGMMDGATGDGTVNGSDGVWVMAIFGLLLLAMMGITVFLVLSSGEQAIGPRA